MAAKPKKQDEAGRVIKSINFRTIVLEKLEQKARDEHTKVSTLVDTICARAVMNDVEYYRQMEKHHHLKAMEYRYMKETAEAQTQVKP